MMFGNDFDKQLSKTLNLLKTCSREREKLKELFYNEYDKVTIVSLIKLVSKRGHPSEAIFVEKFGDEYKSGNFDEVEISQFKRLFDKYKPDLIQMLEEEDKK